MHPQRFALIGGLVMLLVGLAAFVPALSWNSETLPPLINETSYGLFLGLFPMNVVNKVAMVLFGLGGIFAWSRKGTELPASVRYSRVVLFVMGALAILGLIPATNTLFGYWPLFGNEVYAHAAFALLGAYFGYALSAKVPEDRTGRHLPRESLAR
ncbi:MAG TPA: DUF4383 domain-containing protein [Bdellovibrionales bacterium]|nr:DUF4383 domain-containing protein [Bdellovibrionales bacterium]